MNIIQHPSPNFGPRRGTDRPNMVIVHYTAMETAEAALDRLCDPGPEVSAHYLIAEDGRVFQLVDEAKRAWHAGAGSWGACRDINSQSLGIELANTSAEPFAEPQLAALDGLLAQLLKDWQISPAHVLGHSDIAPGRKIDPGPKFPWSRLAHLGMAQTSPETASAPADPNRFIAAAQVFGYTAEVEGDQLGAYLHAFRLRFRQNAVGKPLDGTDVSMIEALAATTLTS